MLRRVAALRRRGPRREFDPATRGGAAVRYAPEPWGTELAATVTGIAPGTACQIWAITSRGQHAAVGGWTVTGDDLYT
jgi:hypothetical protein